MNKALFLDRDGVINVEVNYLHKIEEFVFIDGIFDLCKHYQSLGYLIIVVTNQSGISRKYYSEADFEKLTSWMINQFFNHDVKISHVYHCPHHEKISGQCSCRKPEPGMLLQAAKDYNIDLSNSIIVGDKERDIQAGINAGLSESYLFVHDHESPTSNATRVVNKLEDIWKI